MVNAIIAARFTGVRHRSAEGKKCFMLDEFARVPPSEVDDGLLQPQLQECASTLSKFVQRSGDTKRLVVTSAALREEQVKQCFGQAAGFFQLQQDGLLCIVP